MSGESLCCFLIVFIYELGMALLSVPGWMGESEGANEYTIMLPCSRWTLQQSIQPQIPTVQSLRNPALKSHPKLEGPCRGATHDSYQCFFLDTAVLLSWLPFCKVLHHVLLPQHIVLHAPGPKSAMCLNIAKPQKLSQCRTCKTVQDGNIVLTTETCGPKTKNSFTWSEKPEQ